jgi:uncharacterized tellurite resistance protein B-like protein
MSDEHTTSARHYCVRFSLPDRSAGATGGKLADGRRTVDKELRRNICRLIAGLVVADDDLEPAEDAFVDKMLAKFEIPPGERDTIFPIVDRSEAAEMIRQLPKEAQATALELLIEATVADGVVAPEEKAYLEAVGQEMGVSSGELEKRVAAKLPKK